MCAIAGAVGFVDDGLVAAVERCADAMRHRGPDARGQWMSGEPPRAPRVVLAHRRLSILDLSAAADQPMVSRTQGDALTFNGEIYNFAALRAELEAAGRTFLTRSDTEVLLAAYERWGTEVFERLRGAFAFALYDARRQRVVLARDRLGEKPLYWTRVESPDGPALLFASEVRGLLASGRVERRLDPAALATYLWNGFVFGPASIVRGVQELPAGTFAELELADPTPRPTRYWSLPRSASRPLARAALRDALTEAVGLQLASDVPLGVFLSGGVDSSAVANLAVRADRGLVHTFNVAFDEAELDESPHARAVAQALGTRHTEIRVHGSTFLESIHPALSALDQPSFDGLNSYVVSRAVRAAGTVVALAGTGGDELFGGYTSFAHLPRGLRLSRRLARLPAGLLASGARSVQSVRARAHGGFAPQTRWGKLGDALSVRGSLVDLYQVAYALFTRDFQRELRPDLDAADAPFGLSASRRAELGELAADPSVLHAISNLELSAFLGQRLLRDTDSAGMAASLEVRLPLVDHRLVELVAGLDEDARFQPLGRKQALRDAGLEGLDPALFERPKAGFVMPFDAWCRGPLRPTLDAVLLDPAVCAAAGLDPAPVRRLWQAFLDGVPGLYWSRVWALFVLGWWCREHRVSA